jgi:UDP-N-acetylmuramoyl-tripeptide--D-alanyl-D-alanine ligase
LGVTALSVAELLEVSGDRLDASDFPSNLDLATASLYRPASGALVLDDTASATADAMAAALKMLVQLAGPLGRSVAVLGELDVPAAEANDEHDRIGRLVVRLNVHKLVVVGHAARHIHNAAGLEGSWDGESQLVATAEEAYDLLREDLREGDVVLLKSSRSARLGSVATRLGGVAE